MTGAAIKCNPRMVEKRSSKQLKTKNKFGRRYYFVFRNLCFSMMRGGVRDHIDEHRGTLAQAVRAFREARRLKDGLPEWQERFPDAVQRLAEDDFAGCIEVCDEVLDGDPDAEEVWKLYQAIQ